MHSSSPHDEIIIKLLMKMPTGNEGEADEEFLIGFAKLSLADVSYFLQQSQASKTVDTAPISVAILIDYLDNSKVREILNPYMGGAIRKGDI